ncbi:MAG: ABC transporter substrate-binding protein [Candidatus Riflebacteria bacterium]|nr:ABC transporter substrate-binding protein [Candidatus Riflebacteria bacterium]
MGHRRSFPRSRVVPWCVGLAVLVAAAAGCSFRGQPAEEDGVVVWHSMAGDLRSVFESIVETFNQGQRGRLKIVPRYQGEYGNLKGKIAMALKAHSPPDMAQMYEAWISYYNAEKGREALVPLDPLVARDAKELDLADIYEVFIRDNTFDGKLYSFPFNKSFPCLFYNKDLFRRAGLDPSKPPATWDEFAAAGRKLTGDFNEDGKIDSWGWAFNVDPWLLECMVLQNGGTLAHGDSDLSPIDAPEVVAAVDFFLNATKGPAPYAYRTNGREFQNDFVGQRVAMIVTTSVSKSFMIDQIGFRWGMAPLPQGKRPVSIMAGTNIGIFARSPREKQEVAWQFIKFFTRADNTAYWAIKTGYVPVRRSAVASLEFQKYLEVDPTPLAAIAQLDHATFEPRAAGWFDVRDKLGQALLRSLLGKGTPRENLSKANAELLRIQGRKG